MNARKVAIQSERGLSIIDKSGELHRPKSAGKAHSKITLAAKEFCKGVK